MREQGIHLLNFILHCALDVVFGYMLNSAVFSYVYFILHCVLNIVFGYMLKMAVFSCNSSYYLGKCKTLTWVANMVAECP